MTPVESVAKAIYLDRNGPGGTPWGRLPHAVKHPYISDAKAAIRTLAENVTERMGTVVLEAVSLSVFKNIGFESYPVLRAAILSALEEE